MKNYDELHNKYLDNELSEKEYEEFKELIENDKEFYEQTIAYKTVEESLKTLPVESPSADFTASVMKRIITGSKSIYKKKAYYFYAVVSSMTLCIFGFAGFVFYNAGISSANLISKSKINGIAGEVQNNFVNHITKFLSETKHLETITTLLLGILMIISYFAFESYRSYKKKLAKF